MLSLEDYFRNSQNSAYRISPDGRYISFLAPYADRMNICVRRILSSDAAASSGAAAGDLRLGEPLRLTQETKRSVAGYMWKGNDRIIFCLDTDGDENFRLYGVKVDGNVEISLTALWDVLNYLDRVEVEIDEDEYNYLLPIQEEYNALYTERNELERLTDIHPGVCSMTADIAMNYARMRHATAADNDMNRTNRQRKLMSAMLDKVMQMSPLELNDLIDFVLSKITTNISTEDMKVYIKELTPCLIGLKLESYQIPAPGTYWGEMVELPDGVGGVLKIEFEKNKKVVAAIQNGEEVPTFE